MSELAKTVYIAGKRIPRDSRWAMLIDGRLSVDDLDDEELIRGQLRSKNGRFMGKPPTWVPRQFVEAMQRESVRRAADRWNHNLLAAQEELINIGHDQRVDAGVRLRALQYVIERSTGKIPERVEMSAQIKPWEQLMGNVALEKDAETMIVDADVVEHEEHTTQQGESNA